MGRQGQIIGADLPLMLRPSLAIIGALGLEQALEVSILGHGEAVNAKGRRDLGREVWAPDPAAIPAGVVGRQASAAIELLSWIGPEVMDRGRRVFGEVGAEELAGAVGGELAEGSS